MYPTLHHFTFNEEILNIITTFTHNAAIGIVVNDLHRSKTAFTGFFKMICIFFSLNRDVKKEDGLISILSVGWNRKLRILKTKFKKLSH